MKGQNTILVVDDDRGDMKLLTVILSAAGYQVRVYANELFCRFFGKINGELIGRKWLPVILASGYDEAQIMAGEHPENPQCFLGKPCQMQALRDAIGKAVKRS